MKRYKVMLATVTAVGLLVASVSVVNVPNKAYAAESERKLESLADLDPAIVDDVRQTMQQLWQGQSLQIELDDIKGGNDTEWSISAKNVSASAIVNKQTGKVVRVMIHYDWDTFDDSLKEIKTLKANITATIRQLVPKGKLQADRIMRWKDFNTGEDRWTFFSNEDNNLQGNMDAANGQLIGAHMNYTLKQIDADSIKIVQDMMKKLTPGATNKLAPNVEVNITGTPGKKELYFTDVKGNHVVVLDDAKRVTEVRNYTNYKGYVTDKELRAAFAKPYYTKKTALAAASPLAKQYFNLDLKGYDVKSDYDEYTFTKKGKPTVKGNINNKGKFWSLSVIY
ncbi:hypothetical protein I6N90_01025 [Paenibacillus sp. GSMTC-2017]|uniref:hypothetical protein n=1 Tax=Paenibacillus sp. GSMTC-2017 TaxID=2794350 RepID=UPI0018D64B2C|nr:hypothetical protein [Paenibacillus sp. GSMTC-2017]MBH5316386.1 hypothetical protein [Paenibacillus sp. GSMTC-2017]